MWSQAAESRPIDKYMKERSWKKCLIHNSRNQVWFPFLWSTLLYLPRALSNRNNTFWKLTCEVSYLDQEPQPWDAIERPRTIKIWRAWAWCICPQLICVMDLWKYWEEWASRVEPAATARSGCCQPGKSITDWKVWIFHSKSFSSYQYVKMLH